MASSKQSTQNPASIVFDNRHASTSPKAPTVGAAVPVDDRHQINKATRQPNIGDVGTPHLIGADDVDTPQQVRISFVLRMRLAGIGTRRHTRQSEGLHQALNPLAIYHLSAATEVLRHPPRAIKRVPRILLIEQTQQ